MNERAALSAHDLVKRARRSALSPGSAEFGAVEHCQNNVSKSCHAELPYEREYFSKSSAADSAACRRNLVKRLEKGHSVIWKDRGIHLYTLLWLLLSFLSFSISAAFLEASNIQHRQSSATYLHRSGQGLQGRRSVIADPRPAPRFRAT